MELIYITKQNKLEELKSIYSRRAMILKIKIKAGTDDEKARYKPELHLIQSKYKQDVLKAKEEYNAKKVDINEIFNDEIHSHKKQYKNLKQKQVVEKKRLATEYKENISLINASDTNKQISVLKGKKETFAPANTKEYVNTKTSDQISKLKELNTRDKARLIVARKNLRVKFIFMNPFNFKNTSEIKRVHKLKILNIKESLPEDSLKAKEIIFRENKRYREELISFKHSKTSEETTLEANQKLSTYEVAKIKSGIASRKDAIKELKVQVEREKLIFQANNFANTKNKSIYKNNKNLDDQILKIASDDPKNILKLKYKNDLLELKKESNKSKNLIAISKNEKGIVVYGSTVKADPKARTKKSLIIGIITVLLIMFLLPFLLLLNTSFKSAFDLFSDSALKLPHKLSAAPYNQAMNIMSFWHSLWWSLLVVIASNLIIIVISSMAAWVLVRRKEWYSKLIFYTILTVMIVPFQAIMLPLIMNADKMHMLNIFGLIFMYTGFGVGLSIFMMHGFLKSVPVALEEAAAVSGAGPIKTFIKVVFPIMKPIFITLFVLNTVWIWNDFLLPSLVLTDVKGPQTLPVKLYQGAVGTFGTQWNILMAGVTLLIIPTIVYFIFAQKYIISGVTQGAIK